MVLRCGLEVPTLVASRVLVKLFFCHLSFLCSVLRVRVACAEHHRCLQKIFREAKQLTQENNICSRAGVSVFLLGLAFFSTY